MPIFRRNDQNILFVHIPKTGGTSLERTFVAAGFEMLYRDGETGPGSVNSLRTVPPQHMHAELLEQMFRLEQFDLIFMVTRHPLARFRSEYGMRNSAALSAGDGSADRVEEWTESAFRRLRRDPRAFHNHLRPQSEFYVPGAIVYRLEDGMDSILADLDAHVGGGLPQEAVHVMNRQKSTGVATRDIVVPPRVRARVEAFYHQDYRQFGYALEQD